jgi:hypothetical protein
MLFENAARGAGLTGPKQPRAREPSVLLPAGRFGLGYLTFNFYEDVLPVKSDTTDVLLNTLFHFPYQ